MEAETKLQVPVDEQSNNKAVEEGTQQFEQEALKLNILEEKKKLRKLSISKSYVAFFT